MGEDNNGAALSSSLRGLSLTESGAQGDDDEGKALSALFLEGQALVEALEEGAAAAEEREAKLARALRLFSDLKVCKRKKDGLWVWDGKGCLLAALYCMDECKRSTLFPVTSMPTTTPPNGRNALPHTS